MATLYISYYGGVQNNCAASPIFTDVVTTSSTSAQGTANTKGAAVASLYSDAAHYFTVGNNPTAAVTNSAFLPADVLVWVNLDNLSDQIAARTVA